MFDGLRIGTGFDVHEFTDGRPLMIGGLDIPFEKGLAGHSDADVLIHAIVDAILGALAMGDIGHYFSPTDPQWKGAPSSYFLKHTRELCDKEGAQILSIDSTLICERPKMKDHIPKIRTNLAEMLGIALDRVHVKATTTEGLGFTGREEGMAAQAVCLLAKTRATTTV